MCCSVCVVLCCRIAVVALMYGFECMCVDLTYVAVRCSVLQYVAVCVLKKSQNRLDRFIGQRIDSCAAFAAGK